MPLIIGEGAEGYSQYQNSDDPPPSAFDKFHGARVREGEQKCCGTNGGSCPFVTIQSPTTTSQPNAQAYDRCGHGYAYPEIYYCADCSKGLTSALYEAGDPKAYADVTCVPKEAFKSYSGNVSLTGLKFLKAFEESAFEGMHGTLKISGKYPVLSTIGAGAFEAVGLKWESDSLIAFSYGLPLLEYITLGAFDSFSGSISLVGNFPLLQSFSKTLFTSMGGTLTIIGYFPSLKVVDAFYGIHGRDPVGSHLAWSNAADLAGTFGNFDSSITFVGGLPSLESLGEGAFAGFQGSITMQGTFPKLAVIGVNSGKTFQNVVGPILLAGTFPALEIIGDFAFDGARNVDSIVDIQCSSNAGPLHVGNAFLNFGGKRVVDGEQTFCFSKSSTQGANDWSAAYKQQLYRQQLEHSFEYAVNVTEVSKGGDKDNTTIVAFAGKIYAIAEIDTLSELGAHPQPLGNTTDLVEASTSDGVQTPPLDGTTVAYTLIVDKQKHVSCSSASDNADADDDADDDEHHSESWCKKVQDNLACTCGIFPLCANGLVRNACPHLCGICNSDTVRCGTTTAHASKATTAPTAPTIITTTLANGTTAATTTSSTTAPHTFTTTTTTTTTRTTTTTTPKQDQFFLINPTTGFVQVSFDSDSCGDYSVKLFEMNDKGNDHNASLFFEWTIKVLPSFATSVPWVTWTNKPPTGLVGTPYIMDKSRVVGGNEFDFVYQVAGGTSRLPPGLSLNLGGQFYGTPTTPGIFKADIIAQDLQSLLDGNEANKLRVNAIGPGYSVSIEIDECQNEITCNGKGKCNHYDDLYDGKFTCSCDVDWIGANCSTPRKTDCDAYKNDDPSLSCLTNEDQLEKAYIDQGSLNTDCCAGACGRVWKGGGKYSYTKCFNCPTFSRLPALHNTTGYTDSESHGGPSCFSNARVFQKGTLENGTCYAEDRCNSNGVCQTGKNLYDGDFTCTCNENWTGTRCSAHKAKFATVAKIAGGIVFAFVLAGVIQSLRQHYLARKDAKSALDRARKAYGLVSMESTVHGGVSVNSGDLVGMTVDMTINHTAFGGDAIDSDKDVLLVDYSAEPAEPAAGPAAAAAAGYNNGQWTYADNSEDPIDSDKVVLLMDYSAEEPAEPAAGPAAEPAAAAAAAAAGYNNDQWTYADTTEDDNDGGHDDDDDDSDSGDAGGGDNYDASTGAIAPTSFALTATTAAAAAKKKKKRRKKQLSKFVAPTINLGKSTLAAKGLDVLLGIDPKTYMHVKNKVKVMLKEFAKNGTDQDKKNLKTLLDGTYVNPGEMHAQSKTMEELMACSAVKDAGLELHHVLALRLYTTSTYSSINNPMRQSPPVLPHPFAATLYYISDALSKLREVQGKDSALRNETLVFWRGMKDLQMTDEFMRTGGSEMACMSTTSSRQVAQDFALSQSPLLFKFVSKSFMSHGADISFLSVYPGEKEVLYPPLTYLRPIRISKEMIGTTVYTVVEVEPVFPK